MNRLDDEFFLSIWEQTSCLNFFKDNRENLLSKWLLKDKCEKIKANNDIFKNKAKLRQILE